MAKPQRKRDRRRHFEASKHKAPLPAERVAAMPFVYSDGRIIAPWPTHGAMTQEDQRRLLCVLDYVRAAPPGRPCWVWPERREPEPINAPDIGRWLARWSEGRATYVARRG